MLTGRAVDFRVSSQATTTARTSCCAFSTGRRGSFRSTAWGWKPASFSFSRK